MKKYYAYIIKETGEKGIFNTWNECRQKVENYKFALYNNFYICAVINKTRTINSCYLA